MSEFDAKAREWDKNQRYIDRSEAVAKTLQEMIPLFKGMKALEYGSGTALLSFALKDKFSEITLMDNSREMIQVSVEKVEENKVTNMKPLFFDLEHEDFTGKFDIIYSQMVLHHVKDINAMLAKFYSLLNPGGYIAVADLYAEDGSFHSEGFKGHMGFDADELAKKLQAIGFKSVKHQQCYEISKTYVDGSVKMFPVFMLTGLKS